MGAYILGKQHKNEAVNHTEKTTAPNGQTSAYLEQEKREAETVKNKESTMPVPQFVLSAYGLEDESLTIEPFGTGLINRTWKVTTPTNEYILQQVNHAVFEKPLDIAFNIREVASYLKMHHPGYCFVAPHASSDGSEVVFQKGQGYFRLFPFVPESHSKAVVDFPELAFEAASQFGRFTRLLSGLDVSRLKVTISSFHDLSLRYRQFQLALQNGNQHRKEQSSLQIRKLLSFNDIVEQYEAIRRSPDFKLRVTHHDTKISNVLFDRKNKGLCVIDLDTVMPGYFISDVGDMMRTYLSPVSEEEADFSKIVVREDVYKAVVKGYKREMEEELTEAERGCFFYAGKFMIYMQALRFLTDHLNDDVYYGARYEGHNLVRAGNQLALLERLLEKQAELSCF